MIGFCVICGSAYSMFAESFSTNPQGPSRWSMQGSKKEIGLKL
jgi:hypothetical protein